VGGERAPPSHPGHPPSRRIRTPLPEESR
jgi:hypothetical protein